MDEIKKFFDDFTFHARVMPVLVIMLPIISLGIYKGIIDSDILDISIYIVVSIIFLTFTSRLAREQGKKYEHTMYKKLGGMPTTIILRYSDKNIDKITKTRYHQKLNKMVDGVVLPIKEDEETSGSDVQYESSINWLRNYANANRDKAPRVYQELKEYNFWRNLYGSKIIVILLYVFVAIREFMQIDTFDIKEMILKPYPVYVAFLIGVISLIAILFFVNKTIVKKKAFDYAKALIEVCDII